MIIRNSTGELRELLNDFPAVGILGPRQVEAIGIWDFLEWVRGILQ
ncbi:MAG: hypothetical protein V3V00_12075 [Saprospiraceae bacterium]